MMTEQLQRSHQDIRFSQVCNGIANHIAVCELDIIWLAGCNAVPAFQALEMSMNIHM
jgi:hypothetical protein